MKRLLWVLVIVFVGYSLFAQNTQLGIVKTKGRLTENQTITKGVPLSDAFVTIQGVQTVSSNKKGLFSVALRSKDYYVKDVNKEGYVLCDADMLTRAYAYSPNPLYIVMETPAQQLEDKILTERKLRKTLQRQLEQREEEIDSLKTRQQISEEEYHRQLQQIYSEQEENERLIKEMAERYAAIDYDQLDEFNRRISTFILDGKLTEADSLIRSKGNISSRVETLRGLQEKNQQEEQALTKRMNALEKSKAYTQKELDDLAQDCYSLFEIFKMQHKNDSAAYYLELRASLDTTNVEWLLELGFFEEEYLAAYDRALQHYHQVRVIGCVNMDTLLIGESYIRMATLHNNNFHPQEALLELDSASYYIQLAGGNRSSQMGICLLLKGVALTQLQSFKAAKECLNEALQLFIELKGENCVEVAQVYQNLGAMCLHIAQEQEAEKCLQKALSILESLNSQNEILIIGIQHNLVVVSGHQGKFEQSIEYGKQLLKKRIELFGDQHPDVAQSYHNISGDYEALQQYDSSLVYAQKSVEIYEKSLGASNPKTLKSYISVASSYTFLNQDSIAEDILMHCLHMYESTIGIYHEEVAQIYTFLCNISIKRKDYETVKEYLHMEEDIFKTIYGESHPTYAVVLVGIADLQDETGDYQLALDNYSRAKNILKDFLPDDHPGIQLVESQIQKEQENLRTKNKAK